MVPVFLDTHFDAVPLGVGLLGEVRARGCLGARVDLLKVADVEVALAMLAECLAVDLDVIAIVRDADQVDALTAAGVWSPRVSCELLNEVDIATNARDFPELYQPSGKRIEPALYSEMIREFDVAVQSAGIVGYVGAVSNLNRRGLDYLQACKAAIDACSTLIRVSCHRYPAGGADESWDRPHDGFRSRADEVLELRRIIGGRRWAVTETGYHTAPRVSKSLFGFRRTVRQWTEADQLEQTRRELEFWASLAEDGPDFVVLYQINSGSDGSPERSGWRRADGTWRPVATVLA